MTNDPEGPGPASDARGRLLAGLVKDLLSEHADRLLFPPAGDGTIRGPEGDTAPG